MRVDDRCHHASGQALIETLLVGALLSMLAALSLLLARLQALDHSTAAATHAIAAECATARVVCADGPATEPLAAAPLRRQFGQRDRDVLSGDAIDPASPPSVEHPFFRGLDGRSLVQWGLWRPPVREAVRFDAGPKVAARASGSPGEAVGDALLREVGPARFGLDAAAGLSTTELNVPVQTPWPGRPAPMVAQGLSIALRGRSALLADAWNAADVTGDSPGSVESRVRRGSALDPLRESALTLGYQGARTSLSAAAALGLEPLGRSFMPGQLDVTVVPADRVGP